MTIDLPDFDEAPTPEWPEEDIIGNDDLEYTGEESEQQSKPNNNSISKAPIKNKPIDQDIDFNENALGVMFLAKYSVMRDLAGNCYLYYPDQGYWKEVSEKYLRSLAMNCDTFKKTSSRRRAAAVDHALDMCCSDYVPWNKIGFDEIAFKDGIYNVSKDEKRAHSYDNYLSGIIPHNYNKDAKCPLWEECLSIWFKDDKNKALALQEFFGYVLCIYAKFKKALMLLGESDTGKSVVCSIAELIVGEHAKSCLPLDKMGDANMLSALKGKYLNLVTEIAVDSTIADGGFKQVVANEPVQINQKFVRVETITPLAKHIIATNNLPEVRDNSAGVFNRLLIIQFNNVIKEKDRQLVTKLEKEIEGIIAWAVEGAKRLINNLGKFTTIRESEDLIKQYKISQNPILAFLEEGEFERSDNENDMIPIKEFCFKFHEWKGGKEWTTNAVGRLLGKMGIKSCTQSLSGKVMRVYPKLKRRVRI